ncbi:hypothetical protein FB45DRAFT_1036060 [Roridomyces roridus]|uniref:Protein kinase domain-containing protein n=1 Tax=Roridomyces roridus TaxID=1738132 RepID=A0AAD7B8Z7_9AGAR|nr:hypothetical protein FB45DRAFT_1036060 [Roridomyces roridus]
MSSRYWDPKPPSAVPAHTRFSFLKRALRRFDPRHTSAALSVSSRVVDDEYDEPGVREVLTGLASCREIPSRVVDEDYDEPGMSFISNASGFTLGEGTFNNIHGDVVIYQDVPRALKRSSSNPLGEPRRKRRRKGDEDGPKIIQNKHLHLDFEIGRGQGYLLHAGNLLNGRAVIVKVFNAGKDARGQLEATVAISRGLFHPNVLRMEGISAPTSIHQFITYEDAHRKTAEGPLAVALRDDLDMSIVLGFKMISDLSSGIDYLNTQGISLPSGPESFDVFLDINNRFLFSINPPTDANTVHDEEDDTSSVWTLFNGLCRKVLRSANRVLHDEDIERTPAIIFDSSPRSPAILKPPPSPSLDQALIQTEEAIPSDHDSVPSVIPPRREYVWRMMEVPQSLATIATQIPRDLALRHASINRLVLTDGGSIHRCPGYVREEVTLATRTADSAVVFHDAPTIQEVCSVCHEVVSSGEVFHCVCGQEEPGSRPTFKCRSCKSWSHWNCGADPDKTICHFCSSETSVIRVEDVSVLEQDAHPPAQSTPEVAPSAPTILSSTHPREMGPVLVDPKELYFDSFDSAYNNPSSSDSDPSFLDDDEELGSVERFPAPPPNTPDDPTMNVFFRFPTFRTTLAHDRHTRRPAIQPSMSPKPTSQCTVTAIAQHLGVPVPWIIFASSRQEGWVPLQREM